MKDIVSKLRHIADANNALIEFDESSDHTYMDCKVATKHIDAFITLTNFNDRYYAYDLRTDAVPSELYLDRKDDSYNSLVKREEEILANLRLFLENKVPFHKRPSLFNKKRGYIKLSIDGSTTKIWLKKNGAGLPEILVD